MSTCDCDRQGANGGNCDCKEAPFIINDNSGAMSFAPVLANGKTAGYIIEGESFEGCFPDPSAPPQTPPNV